MTRIERQKRELARLKEQSHREVETLKVGKNRVAQLEEKIKRQRNELAVLNKKLQSSNKRGSLDLMTRIERQKRELARLNKQVEKMSQTEKKALILSSME
jgi:DNA repair exonuclease SbcCD ATPase subunit